MMQTFRNRKTRTYEDHRNTCRCMQQFWLIIVASGDSSPTKNAQETKALILFFDTLPRSAHALACWEYGARPSSSWWSGTGYGRLWIVKLEKCATMMKLKISWSCYGRKEESDWRCSKSSGRNCWQSVGFAYGVSIFFAASLEEMIAREVVWRLEYKCRG